MIKIISKEYSTAVVQLQKLFLNNGALCDVAVCSSYENYFANVKLSLSGGSTVILLGDSCKLKQYLANVFSLQMYYERYVEKCLVESCNASGKQKLAQHELDKLCSMPEGFEVCGVPSLHSICYKGEICKARIFVLPDDNLVASKIAENYVLAGVKGKSNSSRFVLRCFGVEKSKLQDILSSLCPSLCDYFIEYSDLDAKLLLTFDAKCAKNTISDTLENIKNSLGDSVYSSDTDETLQNKVVHLLGKLHKNLSTAESVTGGLIASNIVSVPGASSVLHESLVTYSVDAKCARLGLNPHFVDEFGVVSGQVARKMVEGLMLNGTDYAVATTGYAGPDDDDAIPTGLCYISVGTPKGVSVYKNVFHGDRNSIRNQAANSALFLLLRSITG